MISFSDALEAIRILTNIKPVEIYDFYLGSQTEEDAYTLHFVNYYWPINFFTYLGQSAQQYIALGIERGGFVQSSQGEISKATLAADDTNGGLTYYASRYKFRDKRIVIRLAFRDNLDNVNNAKLLFDGKITSIAFEQKEKKRKITITANPKLGSLRYKTGWPYSIKCNCQFGDQFCKQDLNSDLNSVTGFIESATTLTITDTTKLVQASDYWNIGYIEFLSGPNVGETRGIFDFDGVTNTLTLDYELAYTPQTGNLYKVTRGCDKTIETCENTYENTENFHGFHTIPLRQDNI